MIATNYIEHANILISLMVIGVIASGVSGALRAIDSRMDITGAILLAFLSANAGGTMRDLILNTQVFWIKDHFYIWLTFTVGALTFIVSYLNHQLLTSKMLTKILLFTDAIGLAVFSLAGVEKALYLGQNYSIAILMGIWTAIGGGIIADIITNRVPLVFSSEFYITVSFVGSVCYILFSLNMNHALASILAVVVMVLFRLCSIRFKLKFPIISK